MGILAGRIRKQYGETRSLTIFDTFRVTYSRPSPAVQADIGRAIKFVITESKEDGSKGERRYRIESDEESRAIFAGDVIRGFEGLTVDIITDYLRIPMAQADVDQTRADCEKTGGFVPYDRENAIILFLNAKRENFQEPLDAAITAWEKELDTKDAERKNASGDSSDS